MATFLMTRTQPEAAQAAERLRAMGHDAIIAPMLEILYVAYPDLPLAGAQALLFTSVNGVRGFTVASAERGFPALCVGDATAAAARAAGFRNVLSADGDAADLADLAKSSLDTEGGRLIHVAGADVAGDLVGALQRAGFDAEKRVIYRAAPVPEMPSAAVAALSPTPPDVEAVLFYSPRGAEVFAERLAEAELVDAASRIEALCLSDSVARAAGRLDWARIGVAEAPREDALLALIDQLYGEG